MSTSHYITSMQLAAELGWPATCSWWPV